jgi:hypothetical protein
MNRKAQMKTLLLLITAVIGLQAQGVGDWEKMDVLAKTTYAAGFVAGFQFAASTHARENPKEPTAVEAIAQCLDKTKVGELSDAMDDLMKEIRDEESGKQLRHAAEVAAIKICKAKGLL